MTNEIYLCGHTFGLVARYNITVITKAYGSEKAYKWESSGADGYVITECDKDSVGTDVIMHIKPDSEEEDYCEYLEEYGLRRLIKKI